MTLVWRPGFSGLTDADAMAYVAAVEAADGQPLEHEVGKAINAFVVGCKNDGIWGAIKASCILSGARTLAGALVPLVGTAPTNFNFVSGDYNRKTGLVGNASTKYLDSNRNNTADPRDSRHLAVYSTAAPTTTNAVYVGAFVDSTSSSYFFKAGGSTAFNLTGTGEGGTVGNPTGFIGCSRSAAASFNFRLASSNNTFTASSVAPSSITHNVFRINRGSNNLYSDARLAFYSIGESLDLTLLDARVTTLINAFAAVIP
jgi:hypothetical protein